MKVTKYIFKITVSLSIIEALYEESIWVMGFFIVLLNSFEEEFCQVYTSLNIFVCILSKNVNTCQNSNNTIFRV